MKKIYLMVFFFVNITFGFGQSVTITPSVDGNIQNTRLIYSQILAIPNPQRGMMAYDLTYDCLRVYNGTEWCCMSCMTSNDIQKLLQAGSFDAQDNLTDIDVDNSGNIYIAGYVKRFVPYNGIRTSPTTQSFFGLPNPSTNPNYGQPSITGRYISKLSPSGQIIWARFFDNGSADGAEGKIAIDIDNTGNVYFSALGGGFDFFLTGVGSTIISTTNCSGCTYYGKFDKDGIAQWVKKVIDSGGGHQVAETDIKVDINNDVYLAGIMRGSITSPFTLTATTTDPTVFLAKINPIDGMLVGTAKEMVKGEQVRLAINSTDLTVLGKRSLYNSNGGTYTFFGTLTKDFLTLSINTTMFPVTSGDDYDIFQNNGDVVRVVGYDGSSLYGLSMAVRDNNNSYYLGAIDINSPSKIYKPRIAMESNGDIILSGNFNSSVTINNVVYNSTVGRPSDIFIAKYKKIGVGNYQFVKAKIAGGSTTNYSPFGNAGGQINSGITLTGAGNIIIGGYFNGLSTFGSGNLTPYPDQYGATNTHKDIFLWLFPF